MNFVSHSSRNVWLGVGGVTLLAAFLRLYDLQLMEFRLDSAYWALQALDILQRGALPLVGQQVGSVNAELYNGPALAYFTALVFRVFGAQPIAVASSIGLLNALCVPLLFLLGQKLYNARVGMLSAALFAVAPWMVLYGRMLWPQSLLPILVALLLGTLAVGVKRERGGAFLVCGILSGVALQLHLSVLSLFAAAVIVIIFYARQKIVALALLSVGAGIGYAPILLYDVQNNFANLRALLRLPALHAVNDPFPTHAAKTIWNFENVMSGQALWVSKLSQTQYLPNAMDWLQGIAMTLLLGIALGAVLWVNARHNASSKNSAPRWRERLHLPFADGMLLVMVFLPTLYLLISRGLIQRHYFIILYPTLFLLLARGFDLAQTQLRANPKLRMVMRGLMFLFALVVLLNLVTNYFMFRFLAERGGEGEFGTVLQDKTRAAQFILADSNQQFRVQLQNTQEGLPFQFLFRAVTPIRAQGPANDPTAVISDSASQLKTYRIVETAYHPLQLGQGERVLFQTRGTVVVGTAP